MVFCRLLVYNERNVKIGDDYMPDKNIKKSENATRKTTVKKGKVLADFSRKPPHDPPKEKGGKGRK